MAQETGVFPENVSRHRQEGGAATSGTKVNSSSLSPKDLVQLVDVLVASKYVADLTQFTRVVAEDMRNMLDAFKQDVNANLPRQVRAMVQ
jgi:hypothetical protein